MLNFKTLRGTQIAAACLGAVALSGGQAAGQNVINSNTTIHSSLCVGFDCANTENYGADTIRLKENNLRIHFEDTSVGSFPSTDWRIIANSNLSGGANFLAINDSTVGRNIFVVSGGAPTSSLFVHSSGRVGLGTSTPSVELHIRDGDTPTVRLEQDGSSGFAPQSWDVAGNETSFFVRDVTNGSRLPFRIRPGAPSQALVIGTDGFVGVGLLSPQEPIHVSNSGDASLRLETTGASQSQWSFLSSATNGHLSIRQVSSASSPAGSVPMVIRNGAPTNSFHIAQNGNVGIGTGGPAAQLHTTGTVRFAALPNCAGIQTNANGVLSCTPGASASAKYASLAAPAGARAGTSGSTAGSSVGAARSGTPGNSSPGGSGNGTADTCAPGDMAGGWSLIGTNIEKFGANSVLWCDVQLTQAQGNPKIRYSISGNCRNHAPNDSTPEAFTIDGKGSITETTACRIGGSFRIKRGSSVVATASIVEGRIEGPASKKTRAVALSRMPRGRASALQTFVLQR
jgi:hypothetical protein